MVVDNICSRGLCLLPLMFYLATLSTAQTPLVNQNTKVLVSSNPDAGAMRNIVDGNDTTMWQSGACFPQDYMARAAMNAALWACNSTTACTASTGSANPYGATDGRTDTPSASLAAPSGSKAWLRVALPPNTPTVTRLGIRGIFPAAFPAVLYVELASGQRLAVAALASNVSYSWVPVRGSWSGVVALYVECPLAFTVTELAAQASACHEQAAVDLGSVQEVGAIRVRYWPGGMALESWLLYSTDGVSYQQVVPALNTSRLEPLWITLAAPLKARFIAVRHRVSEQDWAKVYVWGIDAFSPAPPPPSPAPSPSPPAPPSPTSIPWNPNAGTVRAFSYQKNVTVSSNPDPKAMANIADGDDNTQWQSDACFPGGYLSRPAMNPLLRLCEGASPRGAPATFCTASAGSRDLKSATDTSVYSSAAIAAVTSTNGQPIAWFEAALPGGAQAVSRVSVKGWYGSTAPLSVVLLLQGGGRVQVVTVTAAENYNWVHTLGSWQSVVGVRLESAAPFSLTEVGVNTGRCVEQATVDMGEIKPVGVLRFRYWSPDAQSTDMLVSSDNTTWTTIMANMDPTNLSPVEIYLPETPYVRYLRIVHRVKEDGDWRKVYVWGIDAYDKYGRWGPPPAPAPHPSSLRQLMGINGIWGWGFNQYSSSLHAKGQGPDMYTPVASRGRNYHGMNWDVRSPLNNPRYDTMTKQGGTDAQWWLNWDKEYVGWKAAGLKVDATFQFLAEDFPPSAWGANATAAAYSLGFAFGSHFGPGRAPANVSLDTVEVGNEPWDYNATFYASVLRGFARGVKDADPTFRLLPCALQAENPYAEGPGGGNFVGARIPAEVSLWLDGLNLHVYSWFRGQDGVSRGVHPEHPGSSMNGLNNMLAWRDANMPGKPVWVTEWGWDSALPGETCNTTLCVSQHAQALYAIRGLMILARKGVAASHWFFYADGDETIATVFTRSGMRGSNSTAFPEKPVFRAVRGLMQVVGSRGFLGVLAERPDLYAYLLGPVGAVPTAATHVLAWRPVAAGEGPNEPTVTATVSFGRLPKRVWMVSGSGAVDGYPLPAVSGGTWSLSVCAVPMLIELQ